MNGSTGVGRGAGPKPRWNPGDEDKLRSEWGTGKSVEAIAVELGRTVGSVRERARRLGLRRPKRSSVNAKVINGMSGAYARTAQSARSASAEGQQAPDKRTVRRMPRRARRGFTPHVQPSEPVDIAAYRVSRPSVTIESVVNFVRSRDYQVVRGESGGFVVDGHKHLSECEFLAWANDIRRQLNKPVFPIDLDQAS